MGQSKTAYSSLWTQDFCECSEGESCLDPDNEFPWTIFLRLG